MFKEILEEEMARKSVFKDPSKLLPDYVPKTLVHRDEEFRQLARIFRPALDSRVGQRVLITGSVGVGKTVLAMKFGEELKSAAKKRDVKLDYIHVNCRKQKSPHMVMQEVANHYLKLPPRGFSPEELLKESTRWLEKHDAYLTLALDEIDFFIQQNGPDMLYALTRSVEELGALGRISIIAIARDQNFTRSLDAGTQSTLMHNAIHLDTYSAEQLIDIMNARIKEAFKAGAVEDDTTMLIADIASRWGDARLALELLWRAGMLADDEGKSEVTPEHARKAKAEIHPEVRKEALRELELHERLVLLALARRLKLSEQAYAMTGEVETAYRVVCEEYGERPRGHTQLWGYLKHAEELGLVDFKPTSKGQRGQSRKISISVPDVPVKSLVEELERLLKAK
jgi:cell division control protein 6